MALQYVGGNSTVGLANASVSVSLTALTGGIAAAAAANDLVIVVYACVSTANRAMAISTAGYTEVAEGYSNDTRDANAAIAWKIMGGTPDTAVVSASPGGVNTESHVVCVHVWRGADTTTPMDVAGVLVQAQINSAVFNSGSITPVTQGAVVISAGAGTGAAADTAITAPTGYGNQVNNSSDPGTAIVVGIASKAWSGVGAEDPAAWSNITTSTGDSWVAFTLALRPAAEPTRRAQVSWVELELPNAPRRAQVSWSEFEVPNAPRRAQVSWVELEIPSVTATRRAQVSWVELELPNAPRRAQVSWLELETPNAPRRAQVSFIELQIPEVGGEPGDPNNGKKFKQWQRGFVSSSGFS